MAFRLPMSSLRWRTRLTLWLAALCAGLAVVAFAKIAEHSLALFSIMVKAYPWIPIPLVPAVGMITVWMTLRYFPGIQGSGIPQVIVAARLSALGKPVNAFVSMRIAIGKVLLGAFALVGGFSAGREGPSVQVAASILHAAHRFLPHSRALRPRDLLVAGGAAGVAAAFNTPLAGIVFAVEELGRKLETRTSGVLISTIIISGLVAIAILGNYNYFGHIRVPVLDRSSVLPVIVGGLLCGLLGGVFSWLLLWPQRQKEFSVWVWRNQHPVWFAGICGLAVATIGLLSGNLSFGSGYEVTSRVVSGEISMPWYAAICRFLATAISYYSGIPGGLFAPSLATGAALGSSLAPFLGHTAETIPIIALFMAGFLAAVTQSPITSAIIVMEMVDGHEMVISLMAIALIAKAVSSRISPELYQQLAHGWLAAEKAHTQEENTQEVAPALTNEVKPKEQDRRQ